MKFNILTIFPEIFKIFEYGVISKGINNKLFRDLILNIFDKSSYSFKENLNRRINEKHNFISKYEALYNIHFPKNQKLLSRAQFRLKYEEFFFIQLQFVFKNLINNPTPMCNNEFHAFFLSDITQLYQF